MGPSVDAIYSWRGASGRKEGASVEDSDSGVRLSGMSNQRFLNMLNFNPMNSNRLNSSFCTFLLGATASDRKAKASVQDSCPLFNTWQHRGASGRKDSDTGVHLSAMSNQRSLATKNILIKKCPAMH